MNYKDLYVGRKNTKAVLFTFVYFLYFYVCSTASVSIKTSQDCLHNERKSGDPGRSGLQL